MVRGSDSPVALRSPASQHWITREDSAIRADSHPSHSAPEQYIPCSAFLGFFFPPRNRAPMPDSPTDSRILNSLNVSIVSSQQKTEPDVPPPCGACVHTLGSVLEITAGTPPL